MQELHARRAQDLMSLNQYHLRRKYTVKNICTGCPIPGASIFSQAFTLTPMVIIRPYDSPQILVSKEREIPQHMNVTKLLFPPLGINLLLTSVFIPMLIYFLKTRGLIEKTHLLALIKKPLIMNIYYTNTSDLPYGVIITCMNKNLLPHRGDNYLLSILQAYDFCKDVHYVDNNCIGKLYIYSGDWLILIKSGKSLIYATLYEPTFQEPIHKDFLKFPVVC